MRSISHQTIESVIDSEIRPVSSRMKVVQALQWNYSLVKYYLKSNIRLNKNTSETLFLLIFLIYLIFDDRMSTNQKNIICPVTKNNSHNCETWAICKVSPSNEKSFFFIDFPSFPVNDANLLALSECIVSLGEIYFLDYSWVQQEFLFKTDTFSQN